MSLRVIVDKFISENKTQTFVSDVTWYKCCESSRYFTFLTHSLP